MGIPYRAWLGDRVISGIEHYPPAEPRLEIRQKNAPVAIQLRLARAGADCGGRSTSAIAQHQGPHFHFAKREMTYFFACA
jgi:hypothetical protein